MKGGPINAIRHLPLFGLLLLCYALLGLLGEENKLISNNKYSDFVFWNRSIVLLTSTGIFVIMTGWISVKVWVDEVK